MADFTLTQEEYEALITLARLGAVEPDDSRRLDSFLRGIEKRNGFTRSSLWVQWQEADQALPPTADFPDKWPPEMRFYIEMVTRPIARSDVDQVLQARARKPVNVLVTPDPGALVGWTEVAKYFTAG
jgi:hypothetical protein